MPNITLYTASAGCGKTERIANLYVDLIAQNRALPQQIVAITYTEKAARELKSRIISKARQSNIDIMTISKIQSSHIKTIHSFCMYLLKFYWMRAKVDANFKIVPDLNSLYYKFIDNYFSVIPPILDKIKIERFFIEEYFHLIEGLIEEYSNSKKYVGKSMPLDKEIAFVFDHIEDMMQNEFLKEITYDLVLEKTAELLQIPEVKKDVNSKFKYLIVDEFQDSNFLQKSIFENICDNIVYVGDKKQSIYRFQGAEPEVFDEALENCNKIIELGTNYRTNSALGKKIDAISQIIFGNNYKPLNYHHQEDGFLKIVEIVCPTKENKLVNEAHFVARKIKEMIEDGYEISVGGAPKRKVRYSDFAILSRKINNIVHIYKNVFERYDIPLEINFKRGLLQQEEIVPLWGLLNILQSPNKKSGYIQLLANRIFGISRHHLLFSSIHNLQELLPDDLRTFISKARESLYIKKLSEILYEFEELFEYSCKVYNIFGENSYENVMLFYDLVEESESFSIDELERFINLQNERMQFGKSLNDSCILMSIHSAKGLSFPIVFLVGLGESVQGPIQRSPKLRGCYNTKFKEYTIAPSWMDDEYKAVGSIFKTQEKEELKRLFYVAITRPMAGLFMVNCTVRPLNKKRGGWSRSFADEIGFSEIVKMSSDVGIEYEKLELQEDKELEKSFKKNVDVKTNSSFPTTIVPDRFENRFRYLSPTHIIDFKSCRALFAFKYIMGLPIFDEANTKSGISQNARILGTTIHRVLELTSLDKLDSLNQNIALAMAENGFDDENLIRNLVYNFFDSPFVSSIKDEIVKEESEMPFYLKLGDQIICGVVDKIYHLSDRVYLLDFKTNLHFDESKFEIYIPQLFLYTKAMLERGIQKSICSAIFWLREGKMFEYKMKDEHLEDILNTIVEIRSIKTREDVLKLIEESVERKDCTGCDFEFYCKDEQNLTLVRKKLE
ncbi:UvrD-helicase domain-containing protein [Caldicellulosiruptor naganoensis]|uniref:DNA 3'-5' helicase n=1 Tax=Caldicellulosiruptor naganoensis TaxID=29324 RepID=A0ABY7BGP5_9FIRM|nr:ATP-dependent DNA helicase [Caldicellulosiruptor naganoensis]WAM32003.1 ATP-dependent helicase [Caldicellulosiruptor naganoensis]